MVAIEQLTTEQEKRTFMSRLRRTLSTSFPGSRAELGWSPSGQIVSGFIGWDGFRGRDSREAVQMVDEVIEERFTPEERNHIVMIIPMPMDALLDHLEPLD